MSTQLLLIQGHPDPAGGHLCHALAQAYADGAREAGHEVRTLDVAQLDFPLLRRQHAWSHEPLPTALLPAQRIASCAGSNAVGSGSWVQACWAAQQREVELRDVQRAHLVAGLAGAIGIGLGQCVAQVAASRGRGGLGSAAIGWTWHGPMDAGSVDAADGGPPRRAAH